MVYLHNQGVVRGDLKGVCLRTPSLRIMCSLCLKANILVTRGCEACIADFGLLRMLCVTKRRLTPRYHVHRAGRFDG